MVAYIIDDMTFVQKQKMLRCTTFEELQEMCLDKILHCKILQNSDFCL